MSFQITGLARDRFESLFALSTEALAQRGVIRLSADRRGLGRAPCRISLIDALDGESILLLNYEHLAAPSPYRSNYAIYVREGAEPAQLEPGEIPAVMRNRPLSLRAFDSHGMLRDADLAQDETLVPTIHRLLGVPGVAELHVHNARHGCYVARVTPGP